MKIQNINDVESFFKIIDQCKGPVELVSPEGDRINLKSKLSQYLSSNHVLNGFIKELDIVAQDKEDIERLIKLHVSGRIVFSPRHCKKQCPFFSKKRKQ